MEYQGKLYGKVSEKFFDTGATSTDWDNMQILLNEAKNLVGHPSTNRSASVDNACSNWHKKYNDLFPKAE